MSNGSGMPQMGAAFAGWTQQITMTRRCDVVSDSGDDAGVVTHKEVSFTFRGTIQPLSVKQLLLKPEGQRAWQWLQVHCFSTTQLNVNDLVNYRGDEYKVMGKWDYSLNGFIEYHLAKDYQS